MKQLFGTDGIRGQAGKFPLDEATVEIIGRSLTRQFADSHGRAPRFVSGRDTRESGTWIERALHRGIRTEGGSVESAAVMTTPGVAFLTKEFGFDAGIVVSASHNPYHDNGIKVFSPSGKKIAPEIERRVEADICGGGFDRCAEVDVDESNSLLFFDRYLDYLLSGFPDLSLIGKKLVVDCANGAASELAPELFGRLGAEVVAIHKTPDGRNINENCGSLHLSGLCERVLEERADIGIAFDGDADRALFADENGQIVDGDGVLWIMANLLKAHGVLQNDTVIATVMSNLGLERALDSIGIGLVRTVVGDKYVLEELLRSGSAVGGEQSGHIIFPQRSLVGDGMMTALFLLEAIWENHSTLGGAVAGFVRYPQILVNIKVREKKPFEDVEPIRSAARATEVRLGNSGRLLLRYSGTENLARVMIEGRDQAEIESEALRLAEIIRENLG